MVAVYQVVLYARDEEGVPFLDMAFAGTFREIATALAMYRRPDHWLKWDRWRHVY